MEGEPWENLLKFDFPSSLFCKTGLLYKPCISMGKFKCYKLKIPPIYHPLVSAKICQMDCGIDVKFAGRLRLAKN
jgi:hypothetical protein